ncbi:hypothetical protein ACWGJP_04545 [Microbacterium sp. NPDC055903]
MRRLLAASCAVLVLLLTGCQAGLSDTGEPLTTEQAESLAQTRFQLTASGPQVLEISIGAKDDVDHLELQVTYDPERHAAWGTMLRGPEGLAVEEQVAFGPDAFAKLQDGQWVVGGLDAGPGAALAVVFALASDRPENAQLLRQSDAVYLGSVDDDGTLLDVYRSPSAEGATEARTRFWLDEDGRLRRVDAGDDESLVIRVTDEAPQSQPEGLPFAGESDE